MCNTSSKLYKEPIDEVWSTEGGGGGVIDASTHGVQINWHTTRMLAYNMKVMMTKWFAAQGEVGLGVHIPTINL